MTNIDPSILSYKVIQNGVIFLNIRFSILAFILFYIYNPQLQTSNLYDRKRAGGAGRWSCTISPPHSGVSLALFIGLLVILIPHYQPTSFMMGRALTDKDQ
jgi:hypothetical protein